MRFWQKIQRILATIQEIGTASLRRLAKLTGLSKSSVDRHLRAKERRNQYPESHLWEMVEGREWLCRMVTAVVLDFGIKRGVGVESLSEFFEHVRLHTHVGISPTAVRGLLARMEQQLISYGETHQSAGIKAGQPKEIVGGVDETFLEQPMLVMFDLVSGYLLLEEFAPDRTTETWRERVEKVLQTFSVRVRYLVSDRAKPLIKLGLEHIGCRSIADLFHALHELAQGFSLAVQRRVEQAQTDLTAVNARLAHLAERQMAPTPQHLDQEQQAQQTLEHWQAEQADSRQHLHAFSLSVHPFDVVDNHPQTTADVAQRLRATLTQLESLALANQLNHADKHLKPVRRLVDDLSGLMTVWWDWVEHSLSEQSSDPLRHIWLRETLLPKVYWECQMKRCRSNWQRASYTAALEHAQQKYAAHPLTAECAAEQLAGWTHWAEKMSACFQRTSSQVEGRNGYLAQINQARRGLSSGRTKALTVLHNFESRRADGTTAAERFFNLTFPDVFEWLASQVGDLPLPRKARRTPVAAECATCPA